MHVSLIIIVQLFNFCFLVSFGFLYGYLGVSLSKDNLQLNVLLTRLFSISNYKVLPLRFTLQKEGASTSISNYKVLPLRFTLQKEGASTFACLFMCLACFLICMLVSYTCSCILFSLCSVTVVLLCSVCYP
jgi:hypothetical protein